MDKSRIGEIIYFYRKHKKISQTKLCRGICSTSTISRIEFGEMEVPMLVAQTLLERMGVAVNKFELISDEKDYLLYKKRCEIQNCMMENDFNRAYRVLGKYEALINEKELLHRQYIALSRAKLVKASQGRLDKAEVLLNEAEQYTLNVAVKSRRDFLLYSQTEIDIILNKARIYMEHGEMEKAEKDFFNLYRYMKKFNSKELCKKLLLEVQLELTENFFREKSYERSLELAKEGLESIRDSRSYQYVAELHFLYARVLWQSSAKKQCEADVWRECVRRCLQAYYLFQFDGNEKKDSISQYLKEELEWEFTK